jgi:hypothetical protein
MKAPPAAPPSAETAHVLFIDLVAYSRLTVEHQARITTTLGEGALSNPGRRR